MNATRNKFSPEFRDHAVRMVDEHLGDCPSEWAAMPLIAVTFQGSRSVAASLVMNGEIRKRVRAGCPRAVRDQAALVVIRAAVSI
jgi:hypothetical protein